MMKIRTKLLEQKLVAEKTVQESEQFLTLSLHQQEEESEPIPATYLEFTVLDDGNYLVCLMFQGTNKGNVKLFPDQMVELEDYINRLEMETTL